MKFCFNLYYLFIFAVKSQRFLNVVDIAGLVKGAHAGQGLGNAFLSHISACDGIFHMTRESQHASIQYIDVCTSMKGILDE